MSLTIGLISLGCNKNLVDSEIMLGQLKAAGYRITDDAGMADVLIINTCGFIETAKEESINTIFEMYQYKERGSCRAVIVTGCLAQRYGRVLLDEMPEIDGIVGTGAVPDIVEYIENILKGDRVLAVGNPHYEYHAGISRVLTTPPFWAYIKIAEGCSNRCSYCAIPDIRGPYRSRYIYDIKTEVGRLAAEGLREAVLVAQDTTRYGQDIYGESRLSLLLKQLAGLEGLSWIRILYSYPTGITKDLIEVIANEDKICKYIDMPLQHISQAVLDRMNRRGTSGYVRNLIKELRSSVNNLTLRTTFIVGFPGETEDDFQRLMDFMEEIQFDHAGVFKYSPEEGTMAGAMAGQVPEEIKEDRFHRAMSLQKRISLAKNKSRLGKILSVLVEGQGGESGKGDLYSGRSQGHAPEVDGKIFFSSGKSRPQPGEIVKVKVQRALEYDLMGELVYEST